LAKKLAKTHKMGQNRVKNGLKPEKPVSIGSPLGIGSKIGFLADFGHFPGVPPGF
jgi:hypothetical protein